MKWLISKVDKLLFGAVMLVCFCLSLQIPAFIAAYVQHLGGARTEIENDLASWEKFAKELGFKLPAYVEKNAKSNDPEKLQISTSLSDKIQRGEKFKVCEQKLVKGSEYTKVYALVKGCWESAPIQKTWELFVPALPLTTSALIYGALGAILGLLLYGVIKKIFLVPYNLFGRWRQRRSAAVATAASSPP